jgi:23S rRNA (pseudouridine1915-N3)-methyltransferase
VAGGTDLVCLARTGEAWSSAQLAEQVSRWQLRARPIAVLVGGSYGLDDELLERAQARWSLGPLTLPHELARVIALEQLYRAWTILRGEPYHKARRNR